MKKPAKRTLIKKGMSDAEATFYWYCKLLKFPMPEREYRFAPERKWRWDFCWRSKMIAVEIQGGVWSGGGHVRGKGYQNDCEKHNAGVMAGWKVFLLPTEFISVEWMDQFKKKYF